MPESSTPTAPRTMADLPAPDPETARRIVALLDGAPVDNELERRTTLTPIVDRAATREIAPAVADRLDAGDHLGAASEFL